MIVQCKKCSKKYRINLDSMNSNSGEFNCHSCNIPIIVNRPSPSNDEVNGLSTISDRIENSKSTIGSASETISESVSLSQWKGEEYEEIKKRWRYGVAQRLMTIMVLIALIPLIGFGIFSLRQTNLYYEKEMANTRKEMVENLASHVDEWIDKNVRVLKALAKTLSIQGMEKNIQERLLQVVQEEYPWMYLVFTIDLKGKNIARSDGKTLKDYSDRLYFKEVLEGKKLAFQTLIGKTSQQPSMVLSVPIMRDNNIIGILAAAMTTGDLSKNVATWRKGKTGNAFLVDEEGKVLAHRRKEFVLEEKNLLDYPLIEAHRKGDKENINFPKDDGEKYIGFAVNTSYGWTIAIEESEKEAFSVLRYTQKVAIIILIITIIGVIIVNIFLSRSITRPIRALTHAADQISLGDMEIEINVKRNDEIGDLAEAVNRMKDSIRLSIKRLKRHKTF